MTEIESPQKLLARKLCPWLVESLISLEAALRANRLGHAWLLTGPAGSGKINLALTFADRLLRGDSSAELPQTLSAAEAVSAMRDRHIPSDHHPDLHWIYPEEDKRNISVEQVRSVSQALTLTALQSQVKIVIIEPAEAMTSSAANALLKTLEEPTEDTYLLLLSHQPGRLAGTLRSRCQVLRLREPSAQASKQWLDLPGAAAAAEDLGLGTQTPIQLAQSVSNDNINDINNIYTKLNEVSNNKLDPQLLADEWLKLDLELLLEWLAAQLQGAIRARFLPQASNPFTDLRIGSLHNAWTALTLNRLFEQLRGAERLRDQVGSGINVDLALRVLLLGFRSDREPM